MEISPEDSIRKWFFMFVKTFIENPEYITIFISKEILRSEEYLLNDVHQIFKNHKKNLVDLIVNAQRINIIKNDINPMHLAIIIIGAMRNIIEDWKLSDYSFDIQKESERLWESICRVMMN
jgi:siderophore synthetase component